MKIDRLFDLSICRPKEGKANLFPFVRFQMASGSPGDSLGDTNVSRVPMDPSGPRASKGQSDPEKHQAPLAVLPLSGDTPQWCEIAGCGGRRVPNLREHYIQEHFPPDMYRWQGMCLVEALMALAAKLLIPHRNLLALEEMAKLFVPAKGFYITRADVQVCKRLCVQEGVTCPRRLSLKPWNCRGLLLHWGILGTLLRIGGPSVSQSFRSFVPSQFGTLEPQQPPTPIGLKRRRHPEKSSQGLASVSASGVVGQALPASEDTGGASEQVSGNPKADSQAKRPRQAPVAVTAPPTQRQLTPPLFEGVSDPRARISNRVWRKLGAERRTQVRSARKAIKNQEKIKRAGGTVDPPGPSGAWGAAPFQ